MEKGEGGAPEGEAAGKKSVEKGGARVKGEWRREKNREEGRRWRRRRWRRRGREREVELRRRRDQTEERRGGGVEW